MFIALVVKTDVGKKLFNLVKTISYVFRNDVVVLEMSIDGLIASQIGDAPIRVSYNGLDPNNGSALHIDKSGHR